MLADHGWCSIIGLRKRPTFTDFKENVVGNALDILVDEPLALLGKFNSQLWNKSINISRVRKKIQKMKKDAPDRYINLSRIHELCRSHTHSRILFIIFFFIP